MEFKPKETESGTRGARITEAARARRRGRAHVAGHADLS